MLQVLLYLASFLNADKFPSFSLESYLFRHQTVLYFTEAMWYGMI